MIRKIKYAVLALSVALWACDDIADDDRCIERDEPLLHQYGDAVIAVSIHAGSFGVPVEYTSFSDNYIGLMQPEGNEYNDRWNIDSWPAGVVNRAGGAKEHDKWAADVRWALPSRRPPLSRCRHVSTTARC